MIVLANSTPSLDLVMNAAANYVVTFTYCQPVPGQPGVPGPVVDVTGFHAKMSFRSSFGDGAALSVSDTEGITIDGPAGAFIVELTPEQTSQLPVWGVYDMAIEDTEGNIIRLVQGNAQVNPAVTVGI